MSEGRRINNGDSNNKDNSNLGRREFLTVIGKTLLGSILGFSILEGIQYLRVKELSIEEIKTLLKETKLDIAYKKLNYQTYLELFYKVIISYTKFIRDNNSLSKYFGLTVILLDKKNIKKTIIQSLKSPDSLINLSQDNNGHTYSTDIDNSDLPYFKDQPLFIETIQQIDLGDIDYESLKILLENLQTSYFGIDKLDQMYSCILEVNLTFTENLHVKGGYVVRLTTSVYIKYKDYDQESKFSRMEFHFTQSTDNPSVETYRYYDRQIINGNITDTHPHVGYMDIPEEITTRDKKVLKKFFAGHPGIEFL